LRPGQSLRPLCLLAPIRRILHQVRNSAGAGLPRPILWPPLSETVTKALGMLKIRPQFDHIEIWQGTHRLYPEPAADKVASGERL
jgi:hypothetical protein